MTYDMQLRFKHEVVKDNLERIGGFKGIHVNPVIGMEKPMNYRNKAQYPVGMDSNGLYRDFTQNVVILSLILIVAGYSMWEAKLQKCCNGYHKRPRDTYL